MCVRFRRIDVRMLHGSMVSENTSKRESLIFYSSYRDFDGVSRYRFLFPFSCFCIHHWP